jgi:hypothetical protein
MKSKDQKTFPNKSPLKTRQSLFYQFSVPILSSSSHNFSSFTCSWKNSTNNLFYKKIRMENAVNSLLASRIQIEQLKSERQSIIQIYEVEKKFLIIGY